MGRISFFKFIAAILALATLTSVFSTSAHALDLSGSTWLVQNIGGKEVNDKVHTTMAFDEAHRVSGLAGCNRYSGPVSLEANTVQFGNLAATRMMCPDAQMDQEQRFFKTLSSVKGLKLSQDDQTLLLYAEGSEPVVRLTRVVEK